MKIVKGHEAITVDHPVFLIFGQPGICKTSLGYSCAEPLLRDYDKGAHRAINRRDTLVIESWADVVESNSAEGLAPYKTVVEDTVGRTLDLLTADIAATDPKKAPGGNLSQQGWGVLKNRFRQHIATLRALGKDVLLIAHDKEDKDGETRIVRPDIVGGSYSEVLKTADFIGYISMVGRNRVLDFSPTDRWIGKNPAGWKPFNVPPPEQAQDFMAELFNLGREALGKISEASAKVAEQVDDWRSTLETLTTVEECNRAIPQTNTYGPWVQPQVKRLLLDRALALGFELDRTKKLFVDKRVAAPVADTVTAAAVGF